VSALHRGLGVAFRSLTIFSTTDLAAEDQTVYLELVAELEHQGYIQKTPANGVFAVVKEQKKVTDARSRYIDPFASISNYVRTGRSILG
jgi:hypothetical protein